MNSYNNEKDESKGLVSARQHSLVSGYTKNVLLSRGLESAKKLLASDVTPLSIRC